MGTVSIKIDNPDKIFFTSDLHFGHKNILKFCNRPFKDVDEMNQKLIENWNSVVPEDGIVFDLGDFAFMPNSKWKEILSQLNGKHHLILGNHDVTRYPGPKIMDLFESVQYQLYLQIENRFVYLNHYPFLCYGGSYKDPKSAVWQLYGHVHTCPNAVGKDVDRMFMTFPYQYDVGVDNNNYTPVSWN